jgi:hypothetical protein
MERGGRFKAKCPRYASRFAVGRPLLLRGLKQTGPPELLAGALLSSLRGRFSNHEESVLPTTRLTELKDLAEKENRMAGVQSKAVIGDFLNGPEHIADPVRDEGLAIPLSESQEYR